MLVYFDFEFTKTIFLEFYVPATSSIDETYEDCIFIADHIENYLNYIKSNVHIREPILGSGVTLVSDGLPFSGAVYLYFDVILPDERLAQLRAEYGKRNLRPEFRSLSWLEYDAERRKK
jgi:hypothetical protein